MKRRTIECYLWGLFSALIVLFVGSCGGGGGGDGGSGGSGSSSSSNPPPVTSIGGSVAPPPAPAAAPGIPGPTPPTTMLLSSTSSYVNFPAIAQSLNYTFDPAASPLLKVSALDFFYPLDTGAFVGPFMSPTPLPGDPTLAEPIALNVLTVMGAGLGPGASTLSNDTLGGLPAFFLSQIVPGGPGSQFAGYAMPYSPLLNPSGFTYQTFGWWFAIPGNLPTIEGYFSTGVPTDGVTLPVTGSATYTGQVSATMVDVATRDSFDVVATVTVTIDFAVRAVVFSSAGTTVLSDNADNAAPGTAYTTRPELDMQGTLTYAAGSNTYTGIVTAANGMNGNATGRFYGAALAAATPTKVAGSPPEIGGTFALMLMGTAAMQGAFGGK